MVTYPINGDTLTFVKRRSQPYLTQAHRVTKGATVVNRFVDKLKGYADLSDAEVNLLESASRDGRRYARNHDLIREGDTPSAVIVIMDGWACRYKILPDGNRQIISFLMPGDFCDLHVATLTKMDHGIATITAATVVTLPREVIERLTNASPTLTKAFWWTQLVDEGVLRATIVSLGRRSSVERVAHLLVELTFRMLNIGIASEDGFAFPFSQIVLADAVGLTPVHVNRVVGDLRRAGALTVKKASLIVADLPKLAAIAGFDENYLHRRGAHIDLLASQSDRADAARQTLARVGSR
ncbi:MAG: Crp/Fnr family transcriptional regulator [Janthinobacterium lividum]